MSSEDPSDEEWERWMSLTDAQMDAELAQSMAEYNKWFDTLSPLQKWRYRLCSCGDNLIRQKNLLAKNPWMTWLSRSVAKTERRFEKILKEKPHEP